MLCEALDTAIEALEKQLDKKIADRSLVKDNGAVVGFIERCPSCNEIIDDTTTVCDCRQRKIVYNIAIIRVSIGMKMELNYIGS